MPPESDLPPAQRLALSYAPRHARAANLALLSLDARLGSILRTGREPLARQLRLAWWRDVLGKPSGEWPKGEPLLDALRQWRDLSCLAVLPAGWEVLLEERLSPQVTEEFADSRAQAFACLAQELDAERPDDAAGAGRIWALADLASNLSDAAERALVVDIGRRLTRPPQLPPSLRPLAVLAKLGEAALARGGGPLLNGPRSTLLALRTGLSGR